MFKNCGSSSTGDSLIGNGGLFWGYDDPSPDEIIQTSFMDEMSSVSNEVKDLLSALKSKECNLKKQERLLSKQQLKIDIKEKEVTNMQNKIALEMERLEKGTLETISALERSITDLKKDNQRLRESFHNVSKSNTTVKCELELVQSRNSKLEKQLASANGRISNLIKLQNLKPKEISQQDKENINCTKKETKKKFKPLVEKKENCCNQNMELIVLLMKALSNTDKYHFSHLFEEVFHHQCSGLLSSLTNYLKQVITSSAVVQYPVLKLTLKCIFVMNEAELSSPSVKMISRKLSDILCINQQYSNSLQLHSRIISLLILTKSSLQVPVLLNTLKQLLLDVQEEGGTDIFLDNAGHQVLLSSLKDPIQQKGILNILILISSDPETSAPILREILPHLTDFIELIQDGDSELITSLSIILQRVSSIPAAKIKLKQASSIFRRIINENRCKNSLVELNIKAVLMNIDNFRQVPNS